MIRIVTDTASDLTLAQAQALAIDRVPLETSFEDGVFPMDTDADYDRFYEKLKSCGKLPVTSRPAPQHYLDIFLSAKAAGDEVLVLTLSSGLSSTIESAQIASEMANYDRITIIDTEQAVMAQRFLAEHAAMLRDAGKTMPEITQAILALREKVVVMGVIGSLVYLKKGGRIPPALAFIGDALGIKPVITVTDKVIKPIGKARGMKAGAAMLYRFMDQLGVDQSYPVYFGYTSDRALGESFMRTTMEKYTIDQARLCQVNGIIGTHLGTDSVGLAFIAVNK